LSDKSLQIRGFSSRGEEGVQKFFVKTPKNTKSSPHPLDENPLVYHCLSLDGNPCGLSLVSSGGNDRL
jgi:hypothetical protein